MRSLAASVASARSAAEQAVAALAPRSWRPLVDALAEGGDGTLAAARRRAFVAAQLGAGLIGLLGLPLWLALGRSAAAPETVAFAFLAAPLAIVAYLGRGGRLVVAQLLSSAAFAALIAWIAGLTGGLASPALAWLAAVPLEASVAASRRATVAAGGLAAVALAAVAAAAALGITEPAVPGAFAAVVVGAAILYACGLAFRMDGVRRLGQRLAEADEARYRLLAEHATDMITRHGPDGDVLFASPAARRLLGVPASELGGPGLFRRVHVADRPAFLTTLAEAYACGAETALEFRLRRAGPAPESFLWVEMRCRRAAAAPGGCSTVIAVTRDIGERKAQEEALLKARESAEEASEAKTRFLAHMSHELRTPLNAIIGFSEILRSGMSGPLAERQVEYARLINASGEHLLEVVNSILDMSKIEAGKFQLLAEPFAPAALAASVLDMMGKQAADRGLRLGRDIPEALPDVTADPRACRQILINLLSNAIKFTDQGGSVVLRLRAEGRMLAMSVRDTGIGIAAEDVPRLGTPFVQADSAYDRRYEGTGLGLSVVKGLAELHGGSMAIDSRLGAGTTVTVRLPIGGAEQPLRLAEARELRRA